MTDEDIAEPRVLIESKSDFARRTNVTPARVSQWISERKISGAALVGDGRSAEINVREALRQLDLMLDLNQRSANGRKRAWRRRRSRPMTRRCLRPSIPLLIASSASGSKSCSARTAQLGATRRLPPGPSVRARTLAEPLASSPP